MLNCLKGQLPVQAEVSRAELEDLAGGLGLRKRSADGSALVCALATYFRYGPDDATACTALEMMVSVRAVDLLQESVDAARVTSEMLFGGSDFYDELAAAESEASGRLSRICQLLGDTVTTICTGGVYLLWCCRRRKQRVFQPLRAADHLSEQIHRKISSSNVEQFGPQQDLQPAGRPQSEKQWDCCSCTVQQAAQAEEGSAGEDEQSGGSSCSDRSREWEMPGLEETWASTATGSQHVPPTHLGSEAAMRRRFGQHVNPQGGDLQ